MLYDQLHALVPRYLNEASGKIFYSGRSAFAAKSNFYLLGFNPGGDPVEQKNDTIGKNIKYALEGREENWSAYVDECWNSKEAGGSLMQRNVQYLCKKLGVNPKHVPASNLVFERTRRAKFLIGDQKQLIKDCWPVHQAVIDNLMVRILICFGKIAGNHVRKVIGANQLIDTFIENNDRHWRSYVHKSLDDRFVITLAHPGVAYWTVNASDPTCLIERLLKLQPELSKL